MKLSQSLDEIISKQAVVFADQILNDFERRIGLSVIQYHHYIINFNITNHYLPRVFPVMV